MYIKSTIVSTRKKTYRYVKLVTATWSSIKGSQEKVICTLGTNEDIIKFRDTIIRGLLALSTESPAPRSRQKRPRGSRARAAGTRKISIQTKTPGDIRGRRRQVPKGSRGKKNKQRRYRR